jgi:hypothetical protein
VRDCLLRQPSGISGLSDRRSRTRWAALRQGRSQGSSSNVDDHEISTAVKIACIRLAFERPLGRQLARQGIAKPPEDQYTVGRSFRRPMGVAKPHEIVGTADHAPRYADRRPPGRPLAMTVSHVWPAMADATTTTAIEIATAHFVADASGLQRAERATDNRQLTAAMKAST